MFCASKKVVPKVKMQLLFVFCVCVVCVQCVPVGEMDVANDHKCGVEASPGVLHHNPWLVYLEYYRGGLRSARCAATLIGRRHLLTAAHCVKNTLYTRLVARLGEYDLKTEIDTKDGVVADPVVRINVADVIVHENYDGTDHDIAVLVLEDDAPYTDFIRPICLPAGAGAVEPRAMFSAAGWGEIPTRHVYSHLKKIIPLPYWTREACLKVYKHLNLPAGVICAGGEEGVDTCRGDSGGPLTLTRDETESRGPLTLTSGRTELWGVTSSGNVYCGTKGSPGIYTSVRHHLEWVHSVVGRS